MAAALLLFFSVSRLYSAPPTERSARARVLILGGGASHDFSKMYGELDAADLRHDGFSVKYTESLQDLPDQLRSADVLIQASNQTAPDAATRSAIPQFLARGGGLVAVHAGVWYNWSDWPDYNRLLIGGGTREHDKLGPFVVTVTHPENPVMAGVPAQFSVEDELYHQTIDPAGAPVEVLATAHSTITGESYPSVWVVKGQPGRIVGIALGHDERTHQNPTYRKIIENAVRWSGSWSPR